MRQETNLLFEWTRDVNNFYINIKKLRNGTDSYLKKKINNTHKSMHFVGVRLNQKYSVVDWGGGGEKMAKEVKIKHPEETLNFAKYCIRMLNNMFGLLQQIKSL